MEELKLCPYCGEKILAVAKKCKHCGEWIDEDHGSDNESIINSTTACRETEMPSKEKYFFDKGFFGYYLERIWCSHMFDIKGNVSRSEFWIFHICNFAILSCLFICLRSANVSFLLLDLPSLRYISVAILLVYFLLYSIMSICILVRRLHDVGVGGWTWLLSFIPLLNLYILYLVCLEGETNTNYAPFKKRDAIALGIAVAATLSSMLFVKVVKQDSQLGTTVKSTININNTEEALTKGKWVADLSGMLAEEGVDDNCKCILTFEKNDTQRSLFLFIEGDTNSDSSSMKYSMSVTGTWEINQERLIMDLSPQTANVQIDDLQSEALEFDFDGSIEQGFRQELLKELRSGVAVLVQEVTKEKNGAKFTIKNDKMILEWSDETNVFINYK